MTGLLRSVAAYLARRKMDRFYGRGADPYGFRGSRYDQERFAAMEAALGERRYRNAAELGAGEGDFTERLAPRVERLVCLEVSEVAVARAKPRLAGSSHVEWVCQDARAWAPPRPELDLAVVAEVLYYLDKPLCRGEFERLFPRVASWLVPGGRLLLVHGYVTDAQRDSRRGYRERFEAAGLRLVSERVVAGDPREQPVSTLLSLLEKPA